MSIIKSILLYTILFISFIFFLAYVLDDIPYMQEPYGDKTSSYSDNIQAVANSQPTPSTTNVYTGAVNSYDTNVVDSSQNGIVANTNYDSNNYNVQYHDDPTTSDQDPLSPSTGTWVNDNGKAVYVDWQNNPQYVTYYTSGAYPYGATSYVPTYEESVYLSKSTGQSTVGTAYPSASTLKGFCQNVTQPGLIEQQCGSLTADQCASTDCCVLLGGNKCVGGNERGPTFQANYSDPLVLNRDVYYYKGNCFGNCDNTNPGSTPYQRSP
jgi:hypothetical protein